MRSIKKTHRRKLYLILVCILGSIILAVFLLYLILDRNSSKEKQLYLKRPKLELFETTVDTLMEKDSLQYTFIFTNKGERPADNITIGCEIIFFDIKARGTFGPEYLPRGVTIYPRSDSNLLFSVKLNKRFVTSLNQALIWSKITFRDIEQDRIDSTISLGQNYYNQYGKLVFKRLTDIEYRQIARSLNLKYLKTK